MDKTDITKLDVQKIHNEIILLISQRFQLTILAGLVFIGYCTWSVVTAFDPGAETFSRLTMINSAYLLVLFFIYLYFVSLLGPMYILSGYLEARQFTGWEIDMKGIGSQREFKFPGYFTGTKYFLLLGVFSILSEALFAIILLASGQSNLLHLNTNQLFGLLINITLGTLLLFLSAGYTIRLSRSGDKFLDQWNSYLKSKVTENRSDPETGSPLRRTKRLEHLPKLPK